MKGLIPDSIIKHNNGNTSKLNVGVIFNRKFRRFLLMTIPTLILFSFIILHITKDESETYSDHIQQNINYVSDNYNQQDQMFNITQLKEYALNIKGYYLAPGNVQFKYINPKNKIGNPDEILKKHEDLYNWVLTQEINEPKDVDLTNLRPKHTKYERANATIITLVRNSELGDISRTMESFEDKFNKKFNYPYTFINDEPFSDEFKIAVKKLTNAPTYFAVIPQSLWKKPSHIDPDLEKEGINALLEDEVAYADMESYHNMCRFYSGNFYNLPELQKFKYYWRIEPSVQFYTNIDYDVFKYMQKSEKVYGFVVNSYDSAESVKSLWPETLKFLNMEDNYKYVNPNGAFQWLLNDIQYPTKNAVAGGYSTCHFWSNFEIADMDFYRDDAYNEWFKYLDSTGKFYYERWGDAPVHSVGVGLFADKSKVHWFRDIGYYHNPFYNCPNTPSKRGCETATFTNAILNSENCMASWIDYGIDDLAAIY
ncbi:nucleotide-diphospho-sugar transferase [Scheffersomyces coipomensis]|uniref:nucleotide-diphospho-sugar transferase n=1 Tax=Scheffersomyces coipomensis TaxID=1788519 RepID=UPI00315D7799